jgi:hypothetical protein
MEEAMDLSYDRQQHAWMPTRQDTNYFHSLICCSFLLVKRKLYDMGWQSRKADTIPIRHWWWAGEIFWPLYQSGMQNAGTNFQFVYGKWNFWNYHAVATGHEADITGAVYGVNTTAEGYSAPPIWTQLQKGTVPHQSPFIWTEYQGSLSCFRM